MILLFVGFIWFGFVEIEKIMTLMWTEVEIPNMMALYIQTSHCYWMWGWWWWYSKKQCLLSILIILDCQNGKYIETKWRNYRWNGIVWKFMMSFVEWLELLQFRQKKTLCNGANNTTEIRNRFFIWASTKVTPFISGKMRRVNILVKPQLINANYNIERRKS